MTEARFAKHDPARSDAAWRARQEALQTPYLRLVNALALTEQGAPYGAATAQEAAVWLRPRICGYRVDRATLQALVDAASYEELRELRLDALTAQRLSEQLAQGGE